MVVPALRGRDAECSRLEDVLGKLRAGQSTVLVVRGEAGIGKTALLEYIVERADGCQVVRALGVEAEMELPFAAIHQLCTPLLGGLERLPPPQRHAAATAFGLSSGPTPDRFLVGLAVLSLLSDAAEADGLICVIDDAQWLDISSAEALSFVARRLHAEAVLLIFAARDQEKPDGLEGLPALRPEPLSDSEARELVDSATIGPLDDLVRDRILAEARGNPLALLELPRGRSTTILAGGFAVPGREALPRQIEASFHRRVAELPEETQRLMLLAAAEPTGDPTLLWRAADELGIPADAADPAEACDLMRIDARVVFRHPLLRSAVYGIGSPDEKRAAHAALAQATDPGVDPDRRAWHRAHAALGPDEELACELELSAARAQARGGLAAAAAFLERAATLTPEPVRRAERTLAAASAKRVAGMEAEASALLMTAEQGRLTELGRATAQRLRGQIALDLSRGAEAAPLLLDAAQRLELFEPVLARETHLDALSAASVAGRFGQGSLVAAAEAARKAPPRDGPLDALDYILDGLAIQLTEGFARGAPLLKQGLAAFRPEDDRAIREARLPWMASRAAVALLDDEMWELLATRHVQIGRQVGALGVLPITLTYLAAVRIHQGRLGDAFHLLDEADAITAATGSPRLLVSRVSLVACQGDEKAFWPLHKELMRHAEARGDGASLSAGEWARAVFHNGYGQYDEAFAAAQQGSDLDELGVTAWALPEFIEAASRSGRLTEAAEGLERFSARTQASGTELALGLEATSRALLSEGTTAEHSYREAVDRLSGTRMRIDAARARLLYGEWLRRVNRRSDARKALRAAHQVLSAAGAQGFADRARRELMATGETVRRRVDETRDDLTPQETQIAALAASGYTNPEIGAQLFLSPRTVEWHLHKVFIKLGINSRKGLRSALRGAERELIGA
jgi:DNA-binding CsgD family transcriptional regulator